MTESKRIVVAVILAAGMAACSPAATPGAEAPVIPETGAQGEASVAQAAVDATPETPVPAAPQPAPPAVQGGQMQGASMQGGNEQGGRQQASALDQRLFGVWVNEQQINSGGGAGGFASLSTVMTMELHPDGRIRQLTQSVGGGGDWSSNSGAQLDFEGMWRASNGTLSVLGMGLPDYTPAATYSFSDQYLVTHNDMGRLIWQKR